MGGHGSGRHKGKTGKGGSAKKIGDWAGVKELVFNLGGEMKKARTQCLMRWGLKAEALARGHISAQDLQWRALSPDYLAWKATEGYSTNILVMTSSYFQSITSLVKDKTAFAGVKIGSKNLKGNDLVSLAAVHEYGNNRTPARPLWQPVYEETMAWTVKENSPTKILISNLAKYKK